ncbi:MAG TPA: UDP-N-acetylglucosamine--N-acetylmuramyl-(pentapeptide) pyrophosphoryl-undecaprenol N-acetylglucosamine transferase [Pirellulales bacterium]
MNRHSMNLVFAGGGTLGHLFAGLAVAHELHDLAPATSIHFAGGGSVNERQHVEAAGYTYHNISCRPWPRRPWRAAGFLVNNVRGYLGGRRMLRRLRADAVVGLGGYVSAPIARAAVSLQLPLVLVEQNALPGRVNRWLSRHAACVCASIDSSAIGRLGQVRLTGAPVRRGFLTPRTEAGHEKLLLVTGGSQGAAALNAAVPPALSRCQSLLTGWHVIHQTGHREVEVTRRHYHDLGIAADVAAFVDLPSLLPHAGLAVCRAGGSTIAELCVTGTPAILCPYPYASDDHQRHNTVAAGDGCRVVDERFPDFLGRLSCTLSTLLANSELRSQMSQAILRRARPNASREIARLVLEGAEAAMIARAPSRSLFNAARAAMRPARPPVVKCDSPRSDR